MDFECSVCGSVVDGKGLEPSCGRCGGAVMPRTRDVNVRRDVLDYRPPGVWRYSEFIPFEAGAGVVSLGEGGTPLLRSSRLGGEIGFRKVMIKDETRNPTGSFVDRGSTVLVSVASAAGFRRLSTFTVGDFGASLAAYCAKAGLEARISVLPTTEQGKLMQMIAFGARLEIVERIPRGSAGEDEVSTANPYLLEGEKTTAFEIAQELGWRLPDAVVVPLGSGGHMTAIWRGLMQLERAGLVKDARTKLIGVQSEFGSRTGEGGIAELEEPDPPFRRSARKAIEWSGGITIRVGRMQSVRSVGLLARTEGIFAEPAAASVIAAVSQASERGLLDEESEIVCVITGSGLKETRSISKIVRTPGHVVSGEKPFVIPLPLGRTKIRLLEALEKKSRFGYELWKEVSLDSGMSTASIYQHLSELEGAALVRKLQPAVVRGRERVYYELTSRGRDALKLVRKGGGLVIG